MHIGDEMEISKEREAFELQEHIKPYLNSVVFDQRNNKYKSEDICEPICNHSARVVNSGWLSWQAAKATPEGFVLVPKVITDEWMAVYVDPEVSKYCKEFEGLPFAVTEKDLPMIQEDFRRPIKESHSRLMKVIEAQEQSHD